jgi:hypothetical protein
MRATCVVLALGIAGCVDPTGDLNAFQKRLARRPMADAGRDSGRDASGCAIAPGDVSGEYLFAISASIAPKQPIVALANVSTVSLDGGTGIAFTIQPLAASDRTTPVDSPLALGPFPVSGSGAFRADISGLQVSGAANPITPGAGISADLVLTGSLCGSGDFFCGNASGQATSPIVLDLTGSTFTMTKVADGGAPPTRPAIDCSGTLADPPRS